MVVPRGVKGVLGTANGVELPATGDWRLPGTGDGTACHPEP